MSDHSEVSSASSSAHCSAHRLATAWILSRTESVVRSPNSAVTHCAMSLRVATSGESSSRRNGDAFSLARCEMPGRDEVDHLSSRHQLNAVFKNRPFDSKLTPARRHRW